MWQGEPAGHTDAPNEKGDTHSFFSFSFNFQNKSSPFVPPPFFFFGHSDTSVRAWEGRKKRRKKRTRFALRDLWQLKLAYTFLRFDFNSTRWLYWRRTRSRESPVLLLRFLSSFHPCFRFTIAVQSAHMIAKLDAKLEDIFLLYFFTRYIYIYIHIYYVRASRAICYIVFFIGSSASLLIVTIIYFILFHPVALLRVFIYDDQCKALFIHHVFPFGSSPEERFLDDFSVLFLSLFLFSIIPITIYRTLLLLYYYIIIMYFFSFLY